MITALTAITVALIARQKAADNFEVLSWQSKVVKHPPGISLVFHGRGAPDGDRVYILGDFQGVSVTPSLLGDGQNMSPYTQPTDPVQISPEATVQADGTWEVDWTLQVQPTASRFTAFTTPAAASCPPGFACDLGPDPPAFRIVSIVSSGKPDGQDVTKITPVAPHPSH